MQRILPLLVLALIGLTAYNESAAETYTYTGVVTLCTGTCDSFASWGLGSQINGELEIETSAGEFFGDADVGSLTFSIFNPAVPPVPPTGDPETDNPYYLDSTNGTINSSGTAGFTDASGNLSSGQLLLEILAPPFDTNGTVIVFNLSLGSGQICLFYDTAGCIPNATQVVVFEGQFTFLDADGDLVGDEIDNCYGAPNPDQRDTDGDGYGNACDADLNSDCVTNYIDLGIFKSVEGTSNADADLNGDGTINDGDLAILAQLIFKNQEIFAVNGSCSSP